MEEQKKLDLDLSRMEEETSSLNFKTIYEAVILHWEWFLLSIILCLGTAFMYLRYATPTYSAYAKILVKDDNNNGYRQPQTLKNMTDLGIVSNSAGLDNEIEIMHSHTIAEETVRDLKLYATYTTKGRIKTMLYYKDQPITVDIDAAHLDDLKVPINMRIERKDNAYKVEGTYYVSPKVEGGEIEGPFIIDKTFTTLPATIPTRAGTITLTRNGFRAMKNGDSETVSLVSPKIAAYKYLGGLSISPTSKMTTIALLTLKDQIPQRAIDYLKQMAEVYNRQANEDKNQIARLTEQFINSRLEKINAELGSTDDDLQNYKERNDMVEMRLNATQSVQNQNMFTQKLNEVETQLSLVNSLIDFMNESSNGVYQVLPSNVGLTDAPSQQLIAKYNELVLERNRLLRSASENSPVVEPITEQIQDLNRNIRRALNQSRRALDITRGSIMDQFNKYTTETSEKPEQERMLTQIGRQQEVKSGLYMMLLQKREENSISLASTADKGKLIDQPQYSGKISPKSSLIMLIALALGIAIPAFIIFLVRFFRYKIEGHDEVAKLTKLPILADVAIASETAKTKADIVVHENQNNQMEEIYRSMRTNLQFMLKEDQKTLLFTSSTSGEGKTFNCANLSVSFALLGKKVILVGLDIRRPRLAELFEIKDHHHGITPLLAKSNITLEDVRAQIVPSGINNDLDLLMAGPIPPNPAELVARPSLETIFDILKKEYDYVIIDSAPVGLVTDTLQLSRVADATVFVCRADYTPRSTFEFINTLAEEKKLPNMSIIINGIDMSKKKYGFYYGYGRYGKYGKYNYSNTKKGYGKYGAYGSYGTYVNSHYGNKKDTSIKR